MPGIFLKYGNYSHAVGECSVAMECTTVRREDGGALEAKWTWSISGMLQGTSPSDLSTKIAALRAAYAVDGQDVGLWISDNGTITPTADVIYNRNSLRGVKVARRPSFPQGSGAEYATYRTYAIGLEWETSESGGSLLAWSQTLDQSGNGGPDWGYGNVPLVGRPQRQQYSQVSLVTIVQSGTAVGNGAYPVAASPLYPAYELGKSRRVTMRQPSRLSREREISWSYTFIFPGPV